MRVWLVSCLCWQSKLWSYFWINWSHVSIPIEHYMVGLAEKSQRLIRCLPALLVAKGYLQFLSEVPGSTQMRPDILWNQTSQNFQRHGTQGREIFIAPAILGDRRFCDDACSPEVLQPHLLLNWYATSLPGFHTTVDRGTDRYQQEETGEEQCLGSARCQSRGSAVRICNSNAEAAALRQGCVGPGTSVSLLAQCGGGVEWQQVGM